MNFTAKVRANMSVCQVASLIWIVALFCTGTITFASPAIQDATGRAPVSPDQIAARIHNVSPKTVVFVFDVTASTRANGVFSDERAATATILRNGCVPGDHVVILKFGTNVVRTVDTVLKSNSESASIAENSLPPSIEPGHGTNIRWPHHEALKIVKHDLPNHGVIILLTDSFNDRPVLSDPNYSKYLDYYSLKGLTVYPHTYANRQYEKLLLSLHSRAALSEFGVHVSIAPSGRPIERLPVGPGQGDAAGDAANSVPVTVPYAHDKAQPQWSLYIAVGLFVLLAIIAAIVWALRRPTRIRLSLGKNSLPQDYVLGPGSKVLIGGLGQHDPFIFPLPGTKTAYATINGIRGGMTINQTHLEPDGEGAVPEVRVFVNGVRVTSAIDLNYNDEIRVNVPAEGERLESEYKIKVINPHEASY